MSRAPFAVIAGLLFFVAYIATVINIADFVSQGHWLLRFFYFAMTGFAWVLPIRWIMLWGARKR